VPSILQTTLKENIISESEMGLDVDRLRSVVFCSGLEPDLASLRGGLNCQIREKSLSGGQRLRVGLARALYRKSDVYLFDDIFSAVDSVVAKHIFQNCILGALKTKTRVLVTHQEFVLPYADLIIQLEDGKIKNQGTYEEMKHHFSNLKEKSEKPSSTEAAVAMSEEAALEIEEEKIVVGTLKWDVLSYYLNIFGKCLFFVFAFLVFVSDAANSLKDWWISHWSQTPELASDVVLGL